MAYAASGLVAAALAAMVLAGCGGVSRLDAQSSHAQDLSGHWVLDHAASEDPEPLLVKLRPRFHSNGDAVPGETLPPVDDRRQSGGRRRDQQDQQQDQQQLNRENDAFERASVLRMLRADLARDPQLTVRQTPGQIALDYGTETRTFTPGAKSVVSAAWGVADQSSGWKGRNFVIEIRPQSGVATTEKYSLADDGLHLVEELTMGGHGYPVVQLKRVYDRTDKSAGRGLPTTD